ncbi:MAG TPA: LytR C-terminal domain-containing protein [Acidimicrobiales bacterium]
METERPSTRSNPARGVALIATAVILGLFILRNGFDDGSSSGATSTTAEPTAGDTTATTGAPDGTGTTAAAPAARPPGEVTVIVANTTSVGGAAGQLSQTISDAGYLTAPATDSPQAVDATQVLYLDGYQADAAAVAGVIQAPATAVAALPDPPPVELAGAQVVVLLGPDLAG